MLKRRWGSVIFWQSCCCLSHNFFGVKLVRIPCVRIQNVNVRRRRLCLSLTIQRTEQGFVPTNVNVEVVEEPALQLMIVEEEGLIPECRPLEVRLL
jgi:hypothetical protein